jgi:hypothetical protein
MRRPNAAKKELAMLREDLAQRDVNRPVLDRYKTLEDTI